MLLCTRTTQAPILVIETTHSARLSVFPSLTRLITHHEAPRLRARLLGDDLSQLSWSTGTTVIDSVLGYLDINLKIINLFFFFFLKRPRFTDHKVAKREKGTLLSSLSQARSGFTGFMETFAGEKCPQWHR